MATPDQPRGDPSAPSDPDNLSAFVARILNQLSLSAWLPGAFLIASAALLAWFRVRGSVTLSGIGSYVQGNWIPVLVLALPALVVTTLLTQAFSFEAIRSLEGYWLRRGPATWLRRVGLGIQLCCMNSVTKRYERSLKKSFEVARPRLKRRVDPMVLAALEAELNGEAPPEGLTSGQASRAKGVKWLDACDPWDTAKMVRLQRELKEFPSRSRMMPTKLGNILRSAEDRLVNNKGDLEGFVMAHREFAPARVLEHHDQFRTRLDMYCTLVFVTAALAVASIPALWELPPLERLLVSVALLITAYVSYGAALSSARGYGTALRQIDLAVTKANEPTSPLRTTRVPFSRRTRGTDPIGTSTRHEGS